MARPSTTTLLLAAVIGLGLGLAPAARARGFNLEEDAPAGDAPASRCALSRAEPERSDAARCTGCHLAIEHATHPVELDYEQSRRAAHTMAGDLRPAAEVRQRGVRLVDGRVTCVTCHDARSRVANHLAIPRGALVRPAVAVRDQASYAWPARVQPVEQVASGAAVSPTALCKACHALD
jgi:hypothetical protein